MLAFLWLGCREPETSPATVLDLTSPLDADEVRLGIVMDPTALNGGLAAEATIGDYKIYNDRASFVIQGLRDGSFYLPQGGNVIDADRARALGEAGRDVVDEWATLLGLSSVVQPTAIDIVSDGSDGLAVLRVTGHDAPLGLIEGVLEAPGFAPVHGWTVVTEYRLAPGSPLMEVVTEVTVGDEDAEVELADLLMVGPEAMDTWADGQGYGGFGGEPRRFLGYVGKDEPLALGMVADAGATVSGAGYELISTLADMAVAAEPSRIVAAGSTTTFRRWWGVADAMATLSDAGFAARGDVTTPMTGVVTAADGPVRGASVVVSVDGAPVTQALTDERGAYTVLVPGASPAAEFLAVGRGSGRSIGTAETYAHFGPYSVGRAQDLALASWSTPMVAPLARGRGVGTAESPLTLLEPARVRVLGGVNPFVARLDFVEADVGVDSARVPGRPDGAAAVGWAIDGSVDLWVEPGTYELVAHRGPRYEAWVSTVTVGPGEMAEVWATFAEAFTVDGWVLGDPHSHASPSPDGKCTMEERLASSAAAGIELHFGTDHDHIADYGPLVEAMGLSRTLRSVVADEVSPPVRGHMNIWPVAVRAGEPNHGSWRWWVHIPETTDWIVDHLRSLHGPDFVLQLNHPMSGGVASSAGWSTGRIDDGDFWTEGFGAVEVLNGGETSDFFDFWLDVSMRGHPAIPVGVSDSHGPFDGGLGFSATWFGTGQALALSTDERLLEAVSAGRVIASRGVFLDMSIDPGAVVAAGTPVEVTARSASYAKVDRLILLRDAVEVARIEGAAGTFTLDTDVDATFVIVAEGDAPMAPVSPLTPWAAAHAIRADSEGDGWAAVVAPLEVSR